MAIIYKITIQLKKYRLQHGLSQAKLAKMVGISQSHVSDIELGIGNPTLATFENMCNILNVHPYDLMDIEQFP